MTPLPSSQTFIHFFLYPPTPHLETELELIQEELEQGSRVEVFVCAGQLPYCIFNPSHDWLQCRKCHSKHRQALSLIPGPVQVHELNKVVPVGTQVPRQQGDLKEVFFEGVNIGIGTLSDMISRHGYVFNLNGKEREMDVVLAAQRLLVQTLISHAIGPEKTMVIFNGRFSLFRTLVEYAKVRQIPYFTHERGGTVDRFTYREEESPHDIHATTLEMEKLWNGHSSPEAPARQWFEDRRSRVQQSWTVFIENQVEGMLPAGFDPLKRNVVIFNSTIEEYETIDCWKNHLFIDEVEGLKILMDHLGTWKDFHFYVRLHPNLKNYESGPQMKKIRGFSIPENFSMIWPEDRVHSYALMDSCEKVAVFSSTIGIEAVYWGKPLILMGRSLYQEMDSFYSPQTLDELWALFEKPLAPKSIAGALKYGLWEAQRGRVFRYFQADGLFAGTYKGRKLLHHPFWELVTQILGLGQKLKKKVLP